MTQTLENLQTFVPMSRADAVRLFDEMLARPADFSPDELRRVLGVLGATEETYLAARSRRQEIATLAAEIATAERGENDEVARITAELAALKTKIDEAQKAHGALQVEHATLLVKLQAAGAKALSLKQRHGRLLVSERSAMQRLAEPQGQNSGRMSFPPAS